MNANYPMPVSRDGLGPSLLRLARALLLLFAAGGATNAVAFETVSIKATRPFGAAGATITAELFKPAGTGPFPAVVLMHGCGGWQPAVLNALRNHALHFTDRGYVVLNVDSFGPRGNSGGRVCESLARLAEARDYRRHDAMDALRYLQSVEFVNPSRIFLMGQSNGGSVAVITARTIVPHGYRAVAAYYPWCGTLDAAKIELATPLIIFSGGMDDWTPARECRGKISVGASLKVVEYADAAHSFDVEIGLQKYLGKRIGFNRFAAEDSRVKMLNFFDAQLPEILASTTD